MEWRRFVTYLSNDPRIFLKKMNCKSEVANSTALYHASNNSSEHRAVMSDSCALCDCVGHRGSSLFSSIRRWFPQACSLIVSLLWVTESTAFSAFDFHETWKVEPLLTEGGR